MNAWGDHFSPILYLFVPLAMVAPGAAPLLVGQTLVLAAGGLAVFGYATRRLGVVPAAGAFALLFLANPSLHGINLRDIHPQAFAITLIVAAALAFDAGRYAWCALALALTLACREDAAVAVVGFGIWLAAARGHWCLGAAVAAASVLLLAVDLKYLMPYFRGEPYPHLDRFEYLGSSLGEILINMVIRPWRWIGIALTGGKLVYLLVMLLPLAFLPLLAPRVLAAALPGLALNLLSVDPALTNFRSQYQAFVLPFLMLAAIEGYARIRAWPRAPAVVALGLLASVLLTARTANDLMVTRWRLDEGQQAAHALMERIPGDAAVTPTSACPSIWRRPPDLPPTRAGTSAYILDHDLSLRARPPSGYRRSLAPRAGSSPEREVAHWEREVALSIVVTANPLAMRHPDGKSDRKLGKVVTHLTQTLVRRFGIDSLNLRRPPRQAPERGRAIRLSHEVRKAPRFVVCQRASRAG
jgi:uncharacterized membrane protein